jgi:hypothetical protein
MAVCAVAGSSHTQMRPFWTRDGKGWAQARGDRWACGKVGKKSEDSAVLIRKRIALCAIAGSNYTLDVTAFRRETGRAGHRRAETGGPAEKWGRKVSTKQCLFRIKCSVQSRGVDPLPCEAVLKKGGAGLCICAKSSGPA